MEYNFIDKSINIENNNLPASDKINEFLLKNNKNEVLKAIEFLKSKELFLYIHGFLGTGKRQFINYTSNFLDKDVIKLEYYCKASTVCDDILLDFISKIEQKSISKGITLNAKITTLNVKFQQYISSIKKPFIIILHSFDDIINDNNKLIINLLEEISQNNNIKIIVSTRAMLPDILGKIKVNTKIFLKAFTREIFEECIKSYNITSTNTVINDFYKYTRGYYYYTVLALKIVQSMKTSLNDFLSLFAQSGKNFDEFLGMTYIKMIPKTIQNFFWFLRTIRHGISINSLAALELYDEFSIEYLKNNLMIFQTDEMLYVQDYFLQNIDISIPEKTEIKLHKYIISIYEKQLKEPLPIREILLSRQALRNEIEYHKDCIDKLENKTITKNKSKIIETKKEEIQNSDNSNNNNLKQVTIDEKLKMAISLHDENKNTEAIELFTDIINTQKVDIHTINTARTYLARLYKRINEYKTSQHYYELVEADYKKNKEVINLNYLYYELTDLYYLMYKYERAINTIKEVIYSVDTPQSLMVASCTLLGNIYSSMNKPEEAYSYYKKAIESLDENTDTETRTELYFKYALANDDRGDFQLAFSYYTKCILESKPNSEFKALAYSNLGSCYLDNNNYSDAKDCFNKAYQLDKSNNNYDGIYYNASNIAKILLETNDPETLNFLLEAKQSADFVNDDFEILKSTIALGDYYYNKISLNKKALAEYFKAKRIATTLGDNNNIEQIDKRLEDMRLRMDKDIFKEIESKYE